MGEWYRGMQTHFLVSFPVNVRHRRGWGRKIRLGHERKRNSTKSFLAQKKKSITHFLLRYYFFTYLFTKVTSSVSLHIHTVTWILSPSAFLCFSCLLLFFATFSLVKSLIIIQYIPSVSWYRIILFFL